jgi:cation-transporting ATPase E
LRENILTLFNLMLSVVALFVLAAGAFQQSLFMLIIIINSAIGIVTELKARQELDRLSILTKQVYTTIRDKERIEISSESILEGDLVTISAGFQIPADGEIISGSIEVNESMLTGESHNISKSALDKVMSGTTCIVGECIMLVESSSSESYAAKLTADAKEFKLASSDLRDGINKILKYISFGIIPVSILLILTNMFEAGGVLEAIANGSWRNAIVYAAAGIIGMIPEGLVLLTSLNFALAAIILARKNVLVTELNSVETLARVNELILDKTGTITDGSVQVVEILDANFKAISPDDPHLDVLYTLSKLPGGTTTSVAISEYLEEVGSRTQLSTISDLPFSSARKYSEIVYSETVVPNGFTTTSATNASLGSSVANGTNSSVDDQAKNCAQTKQVKNHAKQLASRLGAPEIIAERLDVTNYTTNGLRVLVCTVGDKVQYIIICQERIRPQAKDIIGYFKDAGVNVQVVSGDNEVTVRSIASQVGIETVVGRAKPETKLEIVKQLQGQGQVVGMTGDGVNDMLALKEADLGIAMGNAAPASKAVANIVLLDSDFAKLPDVVGQGRRVIANIERVASLFLVKTFYSIALSFITVAMQINYPFMPIQLTLVSALCIGIPAFFLALPPNNTRYRPGFLKRVLKFSLPLGICIAICVIVVDVNFKEAFPGVTIITLAALSFIVLAIKCRPLLSWRLIMFIALVGLFVAGYFIPFTASFFMFYA